MSKVIYWNTEKGDDKKTGLSPEDAVKTQERVSELLEKDVDIQQSKTGCLTVFPGRDVEFTKT